MPWPVDGTYALPAFPNGSNAVCHFFVVALFVYFWGAFLAVTGLMPLLVVRPVVLLVQLETSLAEYVVVELIREMDLCVAGSGETAC